MMIMLGALKMKVSIKDAKFCSFYQSQDMDLCFKEVFETQFSFFSSILGAPQPCPIDFLPTAAPLGSWKYLLVSCKRF